MRWSVKDPAAADGPSEKKNEEFRQVRDEIKVKVEELLNQIVQRNRTAA
jgi:protein-tyrosine-phosphatase